MDKIYNAQEICIKIKKIRVFFDSKSNETIL